MKVPEINKLTFQKILRELDIIQYPSLKEDGYLMKLREKLLNKGNLVLSEKLIGFARFKLYLDGLRKQTNKYYIEKIDFTAFAARAPKGFQEDGIKWLIKNDRCILADDQGLGKSIQVILASLCLQEDYKILIVTKKTLKYNFAKEISFYSDSYKVIEKKWETGFKFTIVHYDSLNKFSKDIIAEQFQVIIADECHVLINKKSKRSKLFKSILTSKDEDLRKLWLLTGTPITNRPVNLYSLLHLIKHPISKNWIKFVEKYCEGYKDKWGRWQVSGASNLTDLFAKTNDSILRRLKKDHLPELPSKDRQPIFLNLENRKAYNQVPELYKERKLEEIQEEFSYITNLFNTTDDIKVSEITKLILWREFCALEKVKDGSLFDLINDELADGNKIIVFTNFTKVVDAVHEHYTDGICRMIDGRITNPQKRLGIVEEFNNNPDLRILVSNLQVGGTGLNIQSANCVIVNDMDWVPGNMLQAEDRAWRFGQLQDVIVKYLVYLNTVEEILYKVVDEKMRNISTAIEGKKENYFEDASGRIIPTQIEKDEEARKRIMIEIFNKM
jgi:SWI/SNF-related matrix-associated actin-dependent regulator 1 of chromatin subfamily A